jgi:LmbE family N-acetylglucosaminyl deacetylase
MLAMRSGSGARAYREATPLDLPLKSMLSLSTTAYDVMVISAHPDDAEVQMGGTIALLTGQRLKVLPIDLCDGEPSDFAAPGVRAEQARRAAMHLGVDRSFLDGQDRFVADTPEMRLTVAQFIREHQPRLVFATTDASAIPALHTPFPPLLTTMCPISGESLNVRIVIRGSSR